MKQTNDLTFEENPVQQPLTTATLFEVTGNAVELFKALAKFRAQVTQPDLNASNPFFKSNYLTLSGLIKAIDEGIKGTGLAYDQIIADYANGTSVQTVIVHEGGGMLLTKPLTLRPQKSDPQGIGSATTYARRYQLQALFGIAGEADDDGNKTTYGNQQPQQRNYNNRPQPQQRNYNNYQQQ